MIIFTYLFFGDASLCNLLQCNTFTFYRFTRLVELSVGVYLRRSAKASDLHGITSS